MLSSANRLPNQVTQSRAACGPCGHMVRPRLSLKHKILCSASDRRRSTSDWHFHYTDHNHKFLVRGASSAADSKRNSSF